MLSKYRMEQANPGMERARITSRLNKVRAEIKEVEAQLEVAKKNAAFEAKYSDDPYWRIAKQKYIETGDPSYVENFRAKQDAFENATKDRASRDEMNRQNKAKQDLYDEAEARKNIRLADNKYKAAMKAGDKSEVNNARVELDAALEHYEHVTGSKYDYTFPGEENGLTGEESTWLEESPLFRKSGAKNAKEYGEYLMQFADRADGKPNKNRLTEADKKLVDEFLAKGEHLDDMGLDDQKVNSIKSHMSQEAAQTNSQAGKKAAEEWWNSLSKIKKDSYIRGEEKIPSQYAPYLKDKVIKSK